MLHDQIYYGLLGALAIGLLVAAFTDIRRRQIDNWLTATIALGAPLFWWAAGLTLWPGVGIQIGVAALTFAVCAALFAMRQMGGGDVKLLTALALWILPAAFLKLIIWMAFIGGFLTIVVGFWHIARRRKDRIAVPYGLAIASSGLLVLGTQSLGNAAVLTSFG